MSTHIIHRISGQISAMRSLLCIVCLILSVGSTRAQFAPVVGFTGTTAIPWDSSAIVAWATGCSVQRGYRDIAVPDSGYASVGDSTSAIGPATQNGVVSLGDGGVAILTFTQPIVNGNGFDFAVFENGFASGTPGMAFLELAFVEVSSDGQRYVRFPAISNVEDTIQYAMQGMDGSLLNNLAGKYVFGYGTPFDLDELKDSAGLDVNNITHVKIIDVVGSINPAYGSMDSRGKIINDPFPTNYASSGFDLDAVGVINQKNTTGIVDVSGNAVNVYPNPFSDRLEIQTKQSGISEYQITDVSGRVVASCSFEMSATVTLSPLPAGVYTIRISNSNTVFSKLIIKE